MSDDRHLADKHSMDIPHVVAVELPLIVKNEDRAIAMLGGKEKIKRVINPQEKEINPSGGMGGEDGVLELRLRNEPFHHPIQSLVDNSERVLVKVSIPKKHIPKDYDEDPSKYTVRELLNASEEKNDGLKYKVQPVAIINKTHLFKAIADFQVSTKNNATIQEFNDSVLNINSFESVKEFVESHEGFSGILDYKKLENYVNKDHQLPPPPVFSPIRFPFDYKFQKNPLTSIVKDKESGELKVVSKKGTIKLHTIIIDFHTDNIPAQAAPELIKSYNAFKSNKPAINSPEFSVLECIEWLHHAFAVKSIWLRKQLEDIVRPDLRKFIKQALPYVSYIFKSGPWRFCNVRFGVNPKTSKEFWLYQSEYFRIPGLHFNVANKHARQRLIPNTIEDKPENKEFAVSDLLLFTGQKVPLTVTYQVGDILDTDIVNIIESSKKELGDSFYRDIPDFQDGWINRQTIETIRRIIRYKLSSIVKEEKIDPAKIENLISKEFVDHEDTAMEVDKAEEDEDRAADDESEEAEAEADGVEDDDENMELDTKIDTKIGAKIGTKTESSSVESVLARFEASDHPASTKLKDLVGFIKQDSLHSE